MKLLTQILFALSIVVVSVSFCLAQSTLSTPVTPTKTIGSAKIYRLKDKTAVESVFLNRDGKSIKATFDSPTTKITKPGMLDLEFYGFWKGFGKSTDKHTEIVWDGGEKFADEANFTARLLKSEDEIENYEILFSLPIAYETIERIANSDDVSITFGDTTIKLTSEEISSLRDLERTIEKR